MEQITKYQEEPKGNRNHKDTLFKKVFSKKKDLLELYNALNDTSYSNEEDLEINTLENVVYISMANDTSFLFADMMNLYEHQGSYNPNMPLRGFLYLSTLYSQYVTMNNLDLYSSRLQKIPTPKFVVFYNGTKEQPDEQILLLSEAFQKREHGKYQEGCLECEALMLNINYGHNCELMEKCRALEEYSYFVDCVRRYTKEYPNRLETAISKAIDECIEKEILLEILKSQRGEIVETVLSSFNRELYERNLKEEAAEEALEKGRAEGRAEGIESVVSAFVGMRQKASVSKDKTLEELTELLQSKEEARKYLTEYWQE